MGKRERITVREIADFFDELSQSYLDPFNWEPNPELPHAQRKTYTIKEFFIARFHNRQCLYFKDEMDICRINFHEIFSANLIYIAQLKDLMDKIARIANADNFYIIGSMDSDSNTNNTITTKISNQNVGVLDSISKFGGFKGDIDATQLPTGLEETRRLVETKGIIEKSEHKIMDYLIPSKHVTHNTNIDKRDDRTTNTFTASNNTASVGKGTRRMIHKKGAVAIQEMQALGVKLRKLRAEFLEKFSSLFHAV